jgi:hypothetical protein
MCTMSALVHAVVAIAPAAFVAGVAFPVTWVSEGGADVAEDTVL